MKLLLQMDPASVQTTLGKTTLMLAAINAAGCNSINIVGDTQVMTIVPLVRHRAWFFIHAGMSCSIDGTRTCENS